VLATGLVNAWFLISGPVAIVSTTYGRWLLAKITLFLVAVIIAGINRIRLTPRLAHDKESAAAIRGLRRNSVMEFAIGFAIFVIMGALGLLMPALPAATAA
jgi:putative copper resistance protein D